MERVRNHPGDAGPPAGTGPAALNFSELTVAEGATLVVGSGSTLRVAGPCTIAGTLVVSPGAEAGNLSGGVAAGLSFSSDGQLSVAGGAGGPPQSFNQISCGPGGGGGGGAIVVVAPDIAVGGSTRVNGGVAGPPVLLGTLLTVISGGGGGGGAVGSGGTGGTLNSTAVASPASAGLTGELYQIVGDPRAVIGY